MAPSMLVSLSQVLMHLVMSTSMVLLNCRMISTSLKIALMSRPVGPQLGAPFTPASTCAASCFIGCMYTETALFSEETYTRSVLRISFTMKRLLRSCFSASLSSSRGGAGGTRPGGAATTLDDSPSLISTSLCELGRLLSAVCELGRLLSVVCEHEFDELGRLSASPPLLLLEVLFFMRSLRRDLALALSSSSTTTTRPALDRAAASA
mmetsp:Transcript_40909/g.103055  ORF Transcript_40909/g.103055 Transcript_40909/m.103055 type:complete len:208 (+) Transcript_40909:2010-2633(+)